MEPARPTCLYCGDVIGVYEPVLVLDHEADRETSLAREPELVTQPNVCLAHSACVPQRWWRDREE